MAEIVNPLNHKLKGRVATSSASQPPRRNTAEADILRKDTHLSVTTWEALLQISMTGRQMAATAAPQDTRRMRFLSD
jgi:hypothetical protein